MNTTLHERQLEEYYCTLCYAFFDLQQRVLTLSNSGLPYPVYCTDTECGQIELPGVPLGSFPGVTYDEVSIPLNRGDLFVFCTDGIFEAMNDDGTEFGAARLRDIVHQHRDAAARVIVDAIFTAVAEFTGAGPQNDDMPKRRTDDVIHEPQGPVDLVGHLLVPLTLEARADELLGPGMR